VSDFPGILNNPSRMTLSTFGGNCAVGEFGLLTGLTSGNAVWPAASRALYIPVQVESTVTAYQMGVIVAVSSGNVDVGIYDQQFARLTSMGSTAVAAAGFQAFNIADVVLTPGIYYLAMCVDNTTASFLRLAPAAELQRTCGVQQQAVGAVTLPNPATPANPASAYVPALMASTRPTL
jgi:hypothetical protein